MMETHLRSAVILGTFPRIRNDDILMTVQKIKIESEREAKRSDKNGSDELTKQANDTPVPMISPFEGKQRLQPEEWERVELRYQSKYGLPCMSDVSRKLSITEALALIRLNVEACYKIPQVCQQNSVFVINSNNLRHFDDIKNDLYCIFKRCQEAN